MPLPNDSQEKWVYKEHTRVKHEILSKYLSGWIRILGRWNTRICYFDCFAGRGEYEDGSKGSPLIAIETASRLKEQFPYLKEIVCNFIEKNENNFKNLESVVNTEINTHPEKYKDVKVIPYNDNFADVASNIINKVGDRLAPSFFFIDPFGFNVPFSTIKDILSIPRTEVFLTLMTRDIRRFLGDEKHKRSLQELFGIENIEGGLSIEYPNINKEQALMALYRDHLHNDADVRYTWSYKICMDEARQSLYYLIHACNHFKGFHLMKNIMYTQSASEGTFAYLGPDEGQKRLLEFTDDISPLKHFLLQQFSGRTLSFWDIMEKSYEDTMFIEKHYRKALKELEAEKRINVLRDPLLTKLERGRTGLDHKDKIVFPKTHENANPN